MSNLKQDLKKMSISEISSKISELRHELFGLRLQAVTSPVKDNTIFRKLRKSIAQALTFLRQKELENGKSKE